MRLILRFGGGFLRFLLVNFTRRQRRKRCAAILKSGLVRPSISQAFADDASGQCRGALAVIDAKANAVVVAEIKFRKIAVQMLFAAMLVDAAHPALED